MANIRAIYYLAIDIFIKLCYYIKIKNKQKHSIKEDCTLATNKYIYWRQDMRPDSEGRLFANVHLLVDYNEGTLADFAQMAEELRRTFPQAKDVEIRGGKVSKSSYVYGFTIIAWDAHIPKGDYPGWRQDETGIPEYYW